MWIYKCIVHSNVYITSYLPALNTVSFHRKTYIEASFHVLYISVSVSQVGIGRILKTVTSFINGSIVLKVSKKFWEFYVKIIYIWLRELPVLSRGKFYQNPLPT